MKRLIAVDLQQIFYYVKSQKKRIDFEKLYKRLTENLNSPIVISYITTSPHTESSYLIDTLKNIGFQVLAKEQKKDKRQLKYITRSVGITLHVCNEIDNYDEITLVTLDSCLGELCEFIKDSGKSVNIWTFKQFESEFLDKADNVYILSEDLYVTK